MKQLPMLEGQSAVPSQFSMIKSAEDASINWIRPAEKGYQEARFVRRVPDYIVVYLSAQSGCNQACRMCHLTATRQTRYVNTTPEDFCAQADVVLKWYKENEPVAETVHFNFMARGEPLDNPHFVAESHRILSGLGEQALHLSLRPRFLISTILPRSLGPKELTDIFPIVQPELYYSIYSTNEEFRKRWLPQALPVDVALVKLTRWQQHSAKIPKIHYAFIEGQNDSVDDVRGVCEAILEHGLHVNVNVVRFNPASEAMGREPSEDVILRNLEVFRQYFPRAQHQVIPRVGRDVYASCGMFVEG